MKLSLPPYLPDQSANSGVLSECKNAYPRVDGYGPINAFSSASDALPAAFRGGSAFIASDSATYLLVGTSTGLVRFNAGAWTSLVSSMSVAGQWRFAQFGNYVVAVNGVTTKVVDLVAATASDLTGAPAGTAIAVVGDYVVIGQDAGDLLGVTNSSVADHTGWTVGVNGCTYQPMLTGGEVMGLAGGEYGIILQRRRLVRMTRTGDDIAPFQYDEITPNVGCASKASIAQYGDTVFFLSDSGFMALSGGQGLPKPIGSEKVDRTFQAAVSRDDYERLHATVDPQNKLVMWCVPGNPGTLWIYNFELDRWSTAELTIDGLFAGFTSSLTLEEVSALYPNLDAMPYSLDNPRFTGGNPRIFLVANAELGTLGGDTLPAVFQLGFGEYAKGAISRFEAIRPITDSTSGDSVILDVRSRMGDPEKLREAGVMRDSGVMPVRATGRYTKVRWEKAAGSVWSYAQGLEFKLAAGGGR